MLGHGQIATRARTRCGQRRGRALSAASGALLAALLAVGWPQHRDAPRSILLFVFDTARKDVVTELLEHPDGMPVLAGLVREGRSYEHAYTNAPWTLPAHGTLFTGLLPSEHRIGVSLLGPREDTTLLAESLHAAGYQTRAVSENIWVSPESEFARGFDRFESPDRDRTFTTALDDALENLDPTRPLFLFVNVMDAHGPYHPHRDEPFLVGKAARRAAAGVGEKYQKSMCRPMPDRMRATLLALYRGGLSRADAKLGLVLDRLEELGRRQQLTSFVTSDHGQHFGEHALIGHLYSVREELIRIPLIVHGPQVEHAVVDSAIDLRQVYGFVRASANLANGSPDPPPEVDSESVTDSIVISQYFDTKDAGLDDQAWVLAALAHLREPCSPERRVFGSMQSVIDYPNKLIEFDRYAPALYDLATDPTEERDLARSMTARHRKRHSRLLSELRNRLPAPPSARATENADELSPEAVEQLRSLGYLPKPAPE